MKAIVDTNARIQTIKSDINQNESSREKVIGDTHKVD